MTMVVRHNHYTESALKKPRVICPICKQHAKEVSKNGKIKSYCCGLWSYDRYPLVSGAIHGKRRTCHYLFDQLWEGGLYSRKEAYKALRQELGLTKRHCHFKTMREETLNLVPEIVMELQRRKIDANATKEPAASIVSRNC